MRAPQAPSHLAVAPRETAGGIEGLGIKDGPDESGYPSSQPSLLARLLLLVIRLWQLTAPMRVPRCRFRPSCSAYAAESIRRYGAVRGGWRALRRISRCHPWNPGGVDPVE